MPRKSKPSFEKRQKEIARQQRMKDKAAVRLEKKARRENAGDRPAGEDPAIAGIRPGPQPLPDEWRDLPTDVPFPYEDEEEDE
jgi:hypothetical protein